MKYFIASILTLFVAALPLFSQEDNWERLAERLEAKAERWATQAERQAERMADRFEASADRWEKNLDKNWNRNRTWEVRFGDRSLAIACPEGVYLGVEAMHISEEKAKKLGFTNVHGSYVSKVMERSSAKQAGLQPFDYIYGVDEQRTSDNQDLTAILEDYKPGDEVTLHFIRKGQKQSVKVKLGSYEELENEDNEEQQRGFLGVSPSGDEDADELDGVEVEIVENSTAKEMGLQDGDVITAVNGYPILDWDDVETAIANTKPGEEVEVIYKREGKEMNAKKALKSYEDAYPEHGDDEEDEDGDEEASWNWNENDDQWNDNEEDQEDRAFLGIHADLLTTEKAKKLGFENRFGSYVTGVVSNTAADKAGIQPFDYIYGVDEYRVGEEQSLGGILKKFKPSDRATVHFIRKGKKSDVNVTFGKQSEAKKMSRNSCEDPFFGINQMGDESGDGVKIDPVTNSTAADLGLKEGDVILSINGFKMIDWTDVETAVEMLKPGENIAVEYRRNGQTMKGSKPIKSYAETKKCENCDCGENVIALGRTPEFKFRIEPPFRSGDLESKPRMDVSSSKVEVAEVGSGEAGELRAKGIDVASNNLAVERLTLSPNPSNGMFKLEFNLPSNGNTVVRVFNNNGRAIYEYELGEFSGNFSDDVDISQNGAGSYFLHISQNGKVFTKKIQLSGK